jgi:D-alanyl-D-alanine dipeptidase
MSDCAADLGAGKIGVSARRRHSRFLHAATIAVVLGLMSNAGARSQDDPALPPDFVRLSRVSKDVRQEIRYAGSHNFVGRPIAGYGAAECWLRKEVAQALTLVAHDLVASGWRLIVYDCYRPERAVADFAAWARDPKEQARKAEFYPALDKEKLFALGYIAAKSGHSTGAAIDAGAEAVDAKGQATPLDFGTAFDMFDPRSATASPGISRAAAQNRRRLASAFAAHGFTNYPREWWHFSYRVAAPRPFDMPITPAR